MCVGLFAIALGPDSLQISWDWLGCDAPDRQLRGPVRSAQQACQRYRPINDGSSGAQDAAKTQTGVASMHD